MPPGSIGRQHIAALVHQFLYHIFFIICIFTYIIDVTCIILSIVICVWTLEIKYLKYLPGTKSSAWMIPACGPDPSKQHMHGSTCVCTMASHWIQRSFSLPRIPLILQNFQSPRQTFNPVQSFWMPRGTSIRLPTYRALGPGLVWSTRELTLSPQSLPGQTS